jgi:hypothetical protein
MIVKVIERGEGLDVQDAKNSRELFYSSVHSNKLVGGSIDWTASSSFAVDKKDNIVRIISYPEECMIKLTREYNEVLLNVHLLYDLDHTWV